MDLEPAPFAVLAYRGARDGRAQRIRSSYCCYGAVHSQ